MDTIKKTYLDFMTEEEYARYNELLEVAATNKANAPKPERKSHEKTAAQKVASLEKKRAALQAKLDALLADMGTQA